MGERLSVSFDERTAARVRSCGAGIPGGNSAYLARLVRADELREAGEAMARWYGAQPAFVEDAEAERVAALDAAT